MAEETCRHCKRTVFRAGLRSGATRTFEPEEFAAEDMPPADSFALLREHGRVVAVPTADLHHPPGRVLVPHYCAQYRETKLDEQLDSMRTGAPRS